VIYLQYSIIKFISVTAFSLCPLMTVSVHLIEKWRHFVSSKTLLRFSGRVRVRVSVRLRVRV